jgi:single-stranded-DNA-specific exonuclease
MFLRGSLADLHEPALLPGLSRAADLLLEKIRQNKKIRVIGDYDVDGICATYILVRSIREMGGDVDYELPDRILDGYGINVRIVEDAIKAGVDTVLTCDNGIAAGSVLEKAAEAGMTVIVTDHHEVPFVLEEDGSKKYILPPGDAVVDPKIPAELTEGKHYPFPEICGAVVAYKLCQILMKKASFMGSGVLKELLSFAALATICDVMPLKDENRILVREGLKEAARTPNQGLKALIEVNDLADKKLTGYHAGFILGPCLNATGRLDSAMKALSLFFEKNYDRALVLAGELKALNDSRKDMTLKGVEEACALAEREDYAGDRVLVLYLPDCHESLAGIIAGRVREQFARPSIVMTRTESGMAKGSGRSIEAYDMFEELSRCRDLFLKFGGHKMAAGLSMTEENVEIFRKRINAQCSLTEEDLVDTIRVDMVMPPGYIDLATVREFESLEPWGQENPKPLFAVKDVTLTGVRILGKNRNVVRLTAREKYSGSLDLIRFEDGDAFLKRVEDSRGLSAAKDLQRGMGNVTIDMVYYPDINSWQGRDSLQYVVKDLRIR